MHHVDHAWKVATSCVKRKSGPIQSLKLPIAVKAMKWALTTVREHVPPHRTNPASVHSLHVRHTMDSLGVVKLTTYQPVRETKYRYIQRITLMIMMFVSMISLSM